MAFPESELESLHRVAIAFPIVVTVAVGLRIYTRRVYARLAVDDWLLLVSWALFLVNCALGPVILNIIRSSGGPPLPENFFHVLRAKASSWVVCLIFLKLSLCFYFLKIFLVELFRLQRYLIITVTVLYELFSIVYFVFTCTSCGLLILDPARAASCSQDQLYHVLSFTWSITNIVTDFFLCALAGLAVHNAHISLSAHISAYLILALGTLGGVASILRLIITAGAGLTLTKTTIWAIVEAGCGLLAASLATLRPLLRSAMHLVRPGHTTATSGTVGSGPSATVGGLSSSKRKNGMDSIDSQIVGCHRTGSTLFDKDLEAGRDPSVGTETEAGIDGLRGDRVGSLESSDGNRGGSQCGIGDQKGSDEDGPKGSDGAEGPERQEGEKVESLGFITTATVSKM